MRKRNAGTITVLGARRSEIRGQGLKAPGFATWTLNLGALTMFAALTLTVMGCGNQPSQTDSQQADTTPAVAEGRKEAAAATDGPVALITEFLEAMRTGNDKKATALLTRAAREKTGPLSGGLRPAASDTAKFAVGKVELVGPDGARVACTWSDLDGDGQRMNDETVWVLRHEAEGWRVAGLAVKVFPDEAPLLLNFEDPADMLRKKRWADEEIRRRAQKEEKGSQDLQAQGGKKAEKSVRR